MVYKVDPIQVGLYFTIYNVYDRSSRPRFPRILALWQHSWRFLAIISLCMRKNGYLWVSGKNIDRGIRFLDLDFLIENYLCDFKTFLLIFAFDMLNVHHISTSGLVDLLAKKVCHVFLPHVENFHQVWSWYDHLLPSYSLLAADTLRDLVTLTFWPFDLGQWSYMVSHMINTSNMFEAPTAICSWVMSSDASTLNITLIT